MNLLTETENVLKKAGKTWEDVVFISNWGELIGTAEFKQAANREYDNGYGGAEVSENLFIVGRDWWLERAEYDGAEWWEFKKKPAKPKTVAESVNLFNR